MRVDWGPFSASGLVAGATALSIGSLLMPQAEEASDMLHLASDDAGRWMAVSLLYFASSVALVIGLPSILTLFDRRGFRHAAPGQRRRRPLDGGVAALLR